MMNKVLLAFALKEELAPWRRRHRLRPVANSPHPVSVTSVGSTEVYVALAGAGASSANFFNDLTTSITPSLGIVTGVAAGLKPEWRSGDVLAAQSVSGPDDEFRIPADPNLIRLAMECGAKPAPVLMTLPRIIRTVEEKVRLASRADAADMESLPLMKQWSAHGVPSLALRVILDPVEMPMTCDFESAMDAHGQVRISKILAQLARHPQLLPDFLHLARQSRHALLILARFLDRFLEQLDRQSQAPSQPVAQK
jgi:adenosylhomocysteine nucleosidase